MRWHELTLEISLGRGDVVVDERDSDPPAGESEQTFHDRSQPDTDQRDDGMEQAACKAAHRPSPVSASCVQLVPLR
jgi:hypothetical protein